MIQRAVERIDRELFGLSGLPEPWHIATIIAMDKLLDKRLELCSQLNELTNSDPAKKFGSGLSPSDLMDGGKGQ